MISILLLNRNLILPSFCNISRRRNGEWHIKVLCEFKCFVTKYSTNVYRRFFTSTIFQSLSLLFPFLLDQVYGDVQIGIVSTGKQAFIPFLFFLIFSCYRIKRPNAVPSKCSKYIFNIFIHCFNRRFKLWH